MKALFTVLVAVSALLVLSACSSTPSKRIAKNQTAFDSYPAEVRSKIRAGKVDLGFTKPQVRMAMGKPDDKVTRQTATGTSEVWIYREGGSSVGFGLGFGTFTGGSTSVGTGVGVGTGDRYPSDKLRVVFESDKVSAIEQAVR